ncbi:hypothetical protein RJT34_29407 [Clitoria ternatea]|uniref:Uncharacterized protein n=1 Tax=Clitoria ternatea TaxID=43366 RepID=A0AAN9ID49_CLITE
MRNCLEMNKDAVLFRNICEVSNKYQPASKSCSSALSKSWEKQMLALERSKQIPEGAFALSVLVVFLYLDRLAGLNTMHIFFVYLQKASLEEHPLVTAISDLTFINAIAVLLQENPFKGSLYRLKSLRQL